MHLYEDLLTVARSPKLVASVGRHERVLNLQNVRRGIVARRGDGTFGEIIPGESPMVELGYKVARGPIATVEIGVEVKILLKAMIKQIDRVINDLRNQVIQFRRGGENPICIGVIGITCTECRRLRRRPRDSHNRKGRVLTSVSGGRASRKPFEGRSGPAFR